MLEMTGVSKVFRTGEVQTSALRSMDLKVAEGEFVADGPIGLWQEYISILPGCSKISPQAHTGSMARMSRLGDIARSQLRNRKIGFIFQGFNLIPDLNLFDNVDVPLRYRRMPAGERRQRIEQALTQVGLGSRMKHFPTQLSGGQQQRVAIARAGR